MKTEVLKVKILYVGDPQVGASKGQPHGEGKLSADSGAANTAAAMTVLHGTVHWMQL